MNEEVNHIGIYTGIDELDVYYDNEDAEDDLLKSCDAAGTAGVDVAAAEKVSGLCNLEEGFWKTREKYGYINLKYWAKVTGYKMDEILHLANGIYIWQDPVRYELSQLTERKRKQNLETTFQNSKRQENQISIKSEY